MLPSFLKCSLHMQQPKGLDRTSSTSSLATHRHILILLIQLHVSSQKRIVSVQKCLLFLYLLIDCETNYQRQVNIKINLTKNKF